MSFLYTIYIKMTKKEICNSNDTFATWYGGSFGLGVELKKIEYGINDFVYFVGVIGDKKTYHKAKINYDENDSFFYWGKTKVLCSECIKL